MAPKKAAAKKAAPAKKTIAKKAAKPAKKAAKPAKKAAKKPAKAKKDDGKFVAILIREDELTEMRSRAEGNAPQTLVTIHPYFTVKDWAKAKPIMADFTKKTTDEDGCIYYGWTKAGNKAFCREAYVDGDAVNAHVKNVGAALQKFLKVAKLDRIEIHGPKAELAKTKAATAALGTVYYEVDSGFQNF